MRKRGVSQSGRRGLHAGNSSGRLLVPISTDRPAPPPPPFFSLSPLVARGSGHGSGLQPPTYARARASSGPPSSFLRVDFLLSQSPLPSLSGLIHQKSLSRLDPGRGGRAGHGHERRSKNEMRLKKQGAPAPLARAPCSRRRGMGVLMSTYLSPRSFEQNTSVAWNKPTIHPYLPLPYRLRWIGGRLIIEFEISASTC